jgi:hypothetical protein
MIPTTDPIKNEKHETPAKPAKPAAKHKERRRKGTTLPPEVRDLEKLIDAFADEFSFAPTEVGKLKTKMALVIEAWRKAEARHREEHLQVRSKLGGFFKGRIEYWINASEDAEMKAFFRQVWGRE